MTKAEAEELITKLEKDMFLINQSVDSMKHHLISVKLLVSELS